MFIIFPQLRLQSVLIAPQQVSICKGTTVCDRHGAQAATVRHLMHTTAREHFHSRVEEHVCDALMCDMVVWRCVTQGASCIVPHTGHWTWSHSAVCDPVAPCWLTI